MPLSDPLKRAALLAEQAACAPADSDIRQQAWAAVDKALDQLIERTEQQAISIFGSVRLQPLPVLAPVPAGFNRVDRVAVPELPEVQAGPATGEPPSPVA